MKSTILKLVVLVLFAAIGGFAAQADDYYVNMGAPFTGASYCNQNYLLIVTHGEWNLPKDAHLYQPTFFNGYLWSDFDYSIPSYVEDSYLYIDQRFHADLPYHYRQVWIFYSDSGLMPSHAFAYNLYCDVNSKAHVSMDVLY